MKRIKSYREVDLSKAVSSREHGVHRPRVVSHDFRKKDLRHYRDEDHSTSSSSNQRQILQLLDVSVFKPFKNSLRRSMDRFMIELDEGTGNLTFIERVAKYVLAKPDNVISDFASTGYWPISAPKVRARRKLYTDRGVKNGSVPSNPIGLTVRL